MKRKMTEEEMKTITEVYLPSSSQVPKENAMKELLVSQGFFPAEYSNGGETAEPIKKVEPVPTGPENGTAEIPESDKPATELVPAYGTPRRISSKQRRMSLEEYRNTFLQVPRIDDRKPVFVSCEVRDRLDEFVRKLGGRKMSVSGLIENIARQHLEIYNEDFEQWRRL